MKSFILAVLLSLTQVAPPVPRKAADKPTQTEASIEKDRKNDGAATAETSQQPQKNDVTVSKPLSVSVARLPKRDLADWAYLGFNFFVVIVGGLQVWLLCRTLLFVRRQTHEMRKQRVAMWHQLREMRAQSLTNQQSVSMQIEKEKPIIKLHIEPFNMDQNSSLYKSIHYKLECSCPTRAVVESAEVKAFIGEFDPVFPLILLPEEVGILNASTDIPKTALIFDQFTDETINKIKSDKLFVHFVAIVSYRGVGAGMHAYKAAARKRWRNTLSAIPGLTDEKWEPYGDPEHNR